MGALLSPQEPARTSGRTGLKGDHGEKVRGGGKGCPSLAALIPAHSAPLPFLPPVPGLCQGPIHAQDRVCPRCIWELAAARAAGTPAEVAALLPQAGIEASLNSLPLLERSQPWPRASLFPPSVSGALPELGSVSSTPSVPSLRGCVPPPGSAASPWWDPARDPQGVDQVQQWGLGSTSLLGFASYPLLHVTSPQGDGVPSPPRQPETPSKGVRCGAGPDGSLGDCPQSCWYQHLGMGCRQLRSHGSTLKRLV